MEYNFSAIEQKWKQYWKENDTYKVSNDSDKPKFYVLDMFPYPSGAGLHVGHPLGYIASDILARYKRLQGYNVLHPMGYDAFGLPAEQYALETGVHPAVSTEKNITRYREQLDNIGFCYDWSREVRTSDPKYYKWTQWIFLQLFHSWYDRQAQKAKPLGELLTIFEKEGNTAHACPGDEQISFDAAGWKAKSDTEQREVLMQYRLAYLDYAEVWWCEALGTVLANDEVVNGVSERGGHPVVKRKMRQWFLRITEFADRLLTSLDDLEWSDAMKEMQRNWIGKSRGAEVNFEIEGTGGALISEINIGGLKGKVTKRRTKIKVFTTRPDTIFGVDFMVLAPEHELVDVITTEAQRPAVEDYKQYVQSRSERERMTEVKQVTGAFTGAYALHPFSGKKIPVYISEYVLAGYGTGAIMAVPSGDDRDHAFAKHFNIPVTNIFGALYNGEEAYSDKSGTLENSDFLNGMDVSKATDAAIDAIVEAGIGKAKINYKLRDAGFSRQRYWGEPFPIVYVNDIPYGTDEPNIGEGLPVELPHVDSYKPGPEGQGPLANITDWMNTPAGQRETNTMPGYAGSSWYFLRYMDPHNDETFAGRKATDYWRQVDVYVGGTEHAVGHLLYSRMWTKALYDLGQIGFEEPFRMLVNQGMIQGSSRFAYRLNGKGAEELLWKQLNSAFPDHAFKREVRTSGIKAFDFVSDVAKVAIEVTSIGNSDGLTMKEYDVKGIEDYQKIILSHDEVFERHIDGSLINFLKEQIVSKDAYLSIAEKGSPFFISSDIKDLAGERGYDEIHVDVNLCDGVELDIERFKKWRGEYAEAAFVLEDGKYICGTQVEKMSKRLYNVVNPDDIVAQYGADTFRMYEMFLGPLEMSKPWDTKGIEGVHRFLKKLWRLYLDEQQGWMVSEEASADAELRILHKTIKKIGEDIERFSFNTAVSQFMICVNELSSLGCRKRGILEPLSVLIAPFAPHLAEELWHRFGHEGSATRAPWPKYEEKYVTDSSKVYPVAVNGKTRVELEFPLDAEQSAIEREVLADPTIIKWLEGKTPQKVIFVKGRMINVVV